VALQEFVWIFGFWHHGTFPYKTIRFLYDQTWSLNFTQLITFVEWIWLGQGVLWVQILLCEEKYVGVAREMEYKPLNSIENHNLLHVDSSHTFFLFRAARLPSTLPGKSTSRIWGWVAAAVLCTICLATTHLQINFNYEKHVFSWLISLLKLNYLRILFSFNLVELRRKQIRTWFFFCVIVPTLHRE
jgi:hypothetical protein